MKTIAKTSVMLSSLLLLTGCWDFGYSKKDGQEKGEAATYGHAEHKSPKCSHKGCTRDHGKDAHNKDADLDDVKTEKIDMDDDIYEMNNMDDMDQNMDDQDEAVQNMNDNDMNEDMDQNEDYSA